MCNVFSVKFKLNCENKNGRLKSSISVDDSGQIYKEEAESLLVSLLTALNIGERKVCVKDLKIYIINEVDGKEKMKIVFSSNEFLLTDIKSQNDYDIKVLMFNPLS